MIASMDMSIAMKVCRRRRKFTNYRTLRTTTLGLTPQHLQRAETPPTAASIQRCI